MMRRAEERGPSHAARMEAEAEAEAEEGRSARVRVRARPRKPERRGRARVVGVAWWRVRGVTREEEVEGQAVAAAMLIYTQRRHTLLQLQW